jgi:hypothetical protein
VGSRAKQGRPTGLVPLTFLAEVVSPDDVNRVIRVTGRVLLGAFVLWQVFFLAASFFYRVEESLRGAAVEEWPALKEEWPRFAKGEDAFHEHLDDFQKKRLKRYGQATTQPQSWGLFAPDVARTFYFPDVELRWDDDHEPGPAETQPRAPVLLPAVNEPADVHAFFRVKDFRFRKYESNCTPAPARVDLAFDPKGERWRSRIDSDVSENGDNMVAYLRWRWREYESEHAEEYRREHDGEDLPKPTQVILHMRAYAIPPPPGPDPWRFIDYGRHPVARWLPWREDQSGVRALQRYDPVNDRYE